MPVPVEEETEDTLPWGEGEPAGCAEQVERVQGLTIEVADSMGDTVPCPSHPQYPLLLRLLEDPGLGVDVGGHGGRGDRVGAGKQWVSSGCKETPLRPWRGTD